MKVELNCQVSPNRNSFFATHTTEGTVTASTSIEIPFDLPMEAIRQLAKEVPAEGARRWYIELPLDEIETSCQVRPLS